MAFKLLDINEFTVKYKKTYTVSNIKSSVVSIKQGKLLGLGWSLLGGFAFWIYAIVIVAKRPQIFYKEYPNG